MLLISAFVIGNGLSVKKNYIFLSGGCVHFMAWRESGLRGLMGRWWKPILRFYLPISEKSINFALIL